MCYDLSSYFISTACIFYFSSVRAWLTSCKHSSTKHAVFCTLISLDDTITTLCHLLVCNNDLSQFYHKHFTFCLSIVCVVSSSGVSRMCKHSCTKHSVLYNLINLGGTSNLHVSAYYFTNLALPKLLTSLNQYTRLVCVS